MVAMSDLSGGAMPARLTGAAGRYRAVAARRILLLLGLAAMLGLSVAVDMSSGPAAYPLADVLRAIVAPASVDDKLRVVIWEIRMPVALMAVTVGAALSAAGAQMQTILANPLASPFTLGLSAAAGFGAALALILGVALVPTLVGWIVPLNAFLMAMATALLIHLFSRMRGVTTETIVLLGIALVFTFNAALAMLQYLASEQALAAVVFWTMGSLVKATWTKVGLTALAVAVVLPLMARRAWMLTALRLGDDKGSFAGECEILRSHERFQVF